MVMDKIRSDIIGIGEKIVALQEEAYYAYRFLVDELCKNTNATENEVGLMLDYLLTFCGNEKVLELYKKVCRTYFNKYPVMISKYIEWYREEYEPDE